MFSLLFLMIFPLETPHLFESSTYEKLNDKQKIVAEKLDVIEYYVVDYNPKAFKEDRCRLLIGDGKVDLDISSDKSRLTWEDERGRAKLSAGNYVISGRVTYKNKVYEIVSLGEGKHAVCLMEK